tara:strand:+ start:16 stop:177 length:162 start_codon:yes stop_codon:yes gene_type:complete
MSAVFFNVAEWIINFIFLGVGFLVWALALIAFFLAWFMFLMFIDLIKRNLWKK